MGILRLVKSLVTPFLLLSLLLGYGTIFFAYFEHIDFFNSFYWTITVLSTVGFGDITPKTIEGKFVFVSLVLFGIGLFGYFVTTLSSIVAEEKLINAFKGLFLLSEKIKMKNHVVIIGWNEIAKSIHNELKINNQETIILVSDEDVAKNLFSAGYKVFVGSPLYEETLKKVEIDKAKCVVLISDDEEILMTALMVRKLSKDVKIIAVPKKNNLIKDLLLQAGVNEVVDVSDVGGRLVASYVFEPTVAKVIEDLIEAATGLDLIEVTIGKAFNMKSLKELREGGLRSLVLAVERKGTLNYYPNDEFKLNTGDKLILAGLVKNLEYDKRILGVKS